MDACLCAALRDAARTATEAYDQALAPTGLRVTMYRLLLRLDEAERPNITELARRMDLDRSTLGRNLKVLARQGLVAFEDAEDERAKTVALTRRGREAVAAARPLWRQAQARMAAALGEDADRLVDILGKLERRSA